MALVDGTTPLNAANLPHKSGLDTITGAWTFQIAVILNEIRGGPAALVFSNNAGSAEGMRLTDAGVLALGTTIVTGATAGNMVIPNNTGGLLGVNSGGTGTIRLIFLNAVNQIELSPGGEDIKWGRPLIALGAGAGATLGTIGAPGPVTAAQNSWMRIIDSTGNASWVPVWK